MQSVYSGTLLWTVSVFCDISQAEQLINYSQKIIALEVRCPKVINFLAS